VITLIKRVEIGVREYITFVLEGHKYQATMFGAGAVVELHELKQPGDCYVSVRRGKRRELIEAELKAFLRRAS
jgi:hypothetical protein